MFRTLVQRLGGREASVGRVLITFMVIGFLSLIAAGIAAFLVTVRNQEHTRSISHTYEVEIAIAQAGTIIEQSETTRRGYLLTGQPIYFDTYTTTANRLPVALDRIGLLSGDNPRQRANLARLRALTDDLKVQRDRTMALARAGRRDEAIRLFVEESSGRRMRAIRDLSMAMGDEERRLLGIRDAEQRASVRAFYATLIVAGILLLLVAVASLLTVLRYTRDLAASRDVLRDFADSLEGLVKERTADLSRANEEIQRFAYIVSHDLRSPLVNVMGFTAELDTATAAITELIDRAEESAPDIVTQEARLAAREDLPEAIGFIRTSTQKMDRLINAILKLSREGRRVISPQPIDMNAQVETIGATLKHMIDDRDATLIVEGELPALVSDRLAIEQIFSNLIENAVKYLQPGRPGRVIVRGSRSGPRVTYEIEDNGRGIAPGDHQRVFDLFRRSGHQDQPGEGIGLAHVRALAYRLGGIIDVSSELGKGATFRLTLPATLSEAQDNRK
ncbi:histidine kinase [Sphingomonas sp. So64.6b]|uniref:sensor histidine kinase n=1 Tax=Sphingomonas sp. So64.6b TaxID=2997354 RepID=UPI001601928B|nr:sensor histidine kinase [Sphingomonas sp. So64.6b]QNA85703.1 histidine kinase [Sphingomonas sp. So64.6b]